MSDMLWTC